MEPLSVVDGGRRLPTEHLMSVLDDLTPSFRRQLRRMSAQESTPRLDIARADMP